MLIPALFLTQKQNPFCREPRFVKVGRSRISIPTVWLQNETTIKEILNSGPMIKRQLPGWYAKEAYWRLSWTLGTTFKTEAVELNPADWHKKNLPLPPRTGEKCFLRTSKTLLHCYFFRLFKVKIKMAEDNIFHSLCLWKLFKERFYKGTLPAVVQLKAYGP